ncbi:hypothetical protein pdam_00016106 [Pocillopora damicornis]|uniref:Uncharacterized protein n=1 Tax=Pocillopora damicornis TaxID=46731 RepID=A0A3M6UB32_POCDA|nr:hypothetical protein pdam_00016106 [Pocillopora damicornis]
MPFPIMFPRVRKDLSDFAIFFARRAFVFQLLEASFCYIYIFKSAKKQFRCLHHCMDSYCGSAVGSILEFKANWVCNHREIRFHLWPWVEARAYFISDQPIDILLQK